MQKYTIAKEILQPFISEISIIDPNYYANLHTLLRHFEESGLFDTKKEDDLKIICRSLYKNEAFSVAVLIMIFCDKEFISEQLPSYIRKDPIIMATVKYVRSMICNTKKQ